MPKKVMGSDGKYYKVNKPFYKKIWFWLLVIVATITIGGALGGESDKKSASNNGGEKIEKSSTSSSKADKTQFYSIGDTVKVGDGEYTLTNVALTEERNEFADNQPTQVVKINYTMKNNGKEDLPVGMDMEVYGSDEKKAESYPNDNTMGSVASGKQMDCTAHFGVNQTGEIEIHFSPLVSFEKAAKFKATI